MSQVDYGLRKILELPSLYNFLQNVMGARRYRKKHFKKYFDLEDGARVLDIGCGTGVLLEYLSVGVEYHGCDMQDEYIKYANEKYGSRGNFYLEKVGDQFRKEWMDYFDVINIHGLLHHLEDMECDILFSACYKYLREGGYLVSVDSVYHDKQSLISRWLVSRDRGQNVRTPNQYLKLVNNRFSKIISYITDNHTVIPFSIFTMVIYK